MHTTLPVRFCATRRDPLDPQLSPSDHAGQHYTRSYQSRANGEGRHFVFPLGHIYQVPHVRGEPKAVAELINGHGEARDHLLKP